MASFHPWKINDANSHNDGRSDNDKDESSSSDEEEDDDDKISYNRR